MFNCQGAGIWPCRDVEHQDPTSSSKSLSLSGSVSPNDLDFLGEIANDGTWTGDCAVYAFHSGKPFNFLFIMKLHACIKAKFYPEISA